MVMCSKKKSRGNSLSAVCIPRLSLFIYPIVHAPRIIDIIIMIYPLLSDKSADLYPPFEKILFLMKCKSYFFFLII